MTCRHCRQPVQRCNDQRFHDTAPWCLGWLHSADGLHTCRVFGEHAEPEPGSLPVTEAPTSEPQGEVA